MPLVKNIQLFGNQLNVLYDDGSQALALPTGNNMWVISGTSDPAPGPGSFDWPFSLNDVTSEFGPRNGRFHEGIDFSGSDAYAGATITAAGAGTVYFKGDAGGFGNLVIIDHGTASSTGKRLFTYYAHMVNPSALVVGNPVAKGATVGLVGNTGNSFGAHLHFETHETSGGAPVSDNENPSYTSNRTAINPRTFMSRYP
jgi:murein DD-endopeptidase MepM/ murein hydrolase activator NlpD